MPQVLGVHTELVLRVLRSDDLDNRLDLLHQPRLGHLFAIFVLLQRIVAVILLSHVVCLHLLHVYFKKFGCYFCINVLNEHLKSFGTDVFFEFQPIKIMHDSLVDHRCEFSNDNLLHMRINLSGESFADLGLRLQVALIFRIEVPFLVLISLSDNLLDRGLSLTA